MSPISINGTTGISGVDGSAGTPSLKGSDTDTGIAFGSDVIIGSTGGTERFRCDSSGRMLVGTSSVSHNSRAVIAGRQDGNAAGTLVLESTSSSPANGDTLGNLRYGTSGNTASLAAAAIGAERDGGTWTNNSSMPTRLTFSTTADGASSPTERMRIANNGAISTVVPGGSTLYPAYDCRAWVNFNGTGVVAIRASGNVSSITDNGTGDYTVNFTAAISDANYSVVATNIGSVNVNQRSFAASSNNALATGSCRMVLVQDSGALNDQDTVSVAIFR